MLSYLAAQSLLLPGEVLLMPGATVLWFCPVAACHAWRCILSTATAVLVPG